MDERFEEAFEAIIEGAQTHHLGRFLRRQKLQIAGILKTDEGMKVIDEECPEKRDILIPLLEHKDPCVRVTVASALLLSRPDLALPVITDIAETSPTIAQQSAGTILCFLEVFGPGVMSLCRPDPRYPIGGKYRYEGGRFIPEDNAGQSTASP